jgi:hypothetical protein
MGKVTPGPVSEWLFQAEHDLAAARAMMTQQFFDWAAFAAQQSGEKSVKAVRLALGTPSTPSRCMASTSCWQIPAGYIPSPTQFWRAQAN